MVVYSIEYSVKGRPHDRIVEARDLVSAKKKLGKKHGYKSGRMVKIERVYIIGYC